MDDPMMPVETQVTLHLNKAYNSYIAIITNKGRVQSDFDSIESEWEKMYQIEQELRETNSSSLATISEWLRQFEEKIDEIIIKYGVQKFTTHGQMFQKRILGN